MHKTHENIRKKNDSYNINNSRRKDILGSSNKAWDHGINYYYIKNLCRDEGILEMSPNMCHLSQHEVAFVIACAKTCVS